MVAAANTGRQTYLDAYEPFLEGELSHGQSYGAVYKTPEKIA